MKERLQHGHWRGH